MHNSYLAAVIVSLVLYGVAGALSLARIKASFRDRLDFAISIVLILWSCAFVAQELSGPSPFPFRKITAGLALLFFSLVCHSSVLPLAGGWKRAGPAAIYAGSLFALIGTAIIPESAAFFYRKNGFLAHGTPLASPIYVFQNCYCMAAGLIGAAVLFVRRSRDKESSDTGALNLRLTGMAGSLAVFYANQLALPAAGGLAAPYFPPLAFSIWALGLLCARFANASPRAETSKAPPDRTQPIPGYSLLVDAEGTILEANDQALAMLGGTAADAKGKPLGSMIFQPEAILGEIRRMAATNAGQSSCQVAWKTPQGRPCQGRSLISAVRNSFGRASGYLLTPFVFGEIGALKEEYSLTDREIEVIHFAAQGLSNQAIARELSITERTVKAHLTNIYNKMGIDGKFKLMSKLKDFEV